MDIAQLGIEVRQTGVVAANKQLEKLVSVGNQLQSVTPKIKDALDSISNDKAYNASLELKDVVASLTQFKDVARGLRDFSINSKSLANLATAAEKLSANNSGLAQTVEHLKAMRAEMEGMKGLGLSKSIPSMSTRVMGESGIKGASSRASQVSDTDDLTAAQKRLISQLEREAMAVGKTRSEYLIELAAKRGVTEQTQQYIDKIKQAEQGNGKYVMSLRATNAAMRMVPAQMTDIVTQLAGGQNPLLIMIQQGGQLRDMFHGFGPMFSALGKFFTPVKIGIMGIVGAVGGLGYAFYEASQQQKEFSNALLLSGNSVGMTTDGLKTMQKHLEGISGSGDAADVLKTLTASGKFTKDNLESVSKAILDLQKNFGISAEETSKTFVTIQDAPLKTLQTINDKMGNIPPAIMEQVRALEQQKRITEAAEIATKAYTASLESLSEEAKSKLGTIERAWLAVKDAAIWAKNTALSYGSALPQSAQIDANIQKIKDLKDELNAPPEQRDMGRSDDLIKAEIANLEKRNAALAVSSKKEEENAAAQQRNSDARRSSQKANDAIQASIDATMKEEEKRARKKQQLDNLAGASRKDLNRIIKEGTEAEKAAAIADLASLEANLAKAKIGIDAKANKKTESKYTQMLLDAEKGVAKEKAKIDVLQNGINAEEGSHLAQLEIELRLNKEAIKFSDAKKDKLRELRKEQDKLELQYKNEAAHKSRMVEYSKQLVALEADIVAYNQYNEKAKFNKSQEFAVSKIGQDLQRDNPEKFKAEMLKLQAIDQATIASDAAAYAASSRESVKSIDRQYQLIGLTTTQAEKQALILESQAEIEKQIRQYKGDAAATAQVEVAAAEKLSAQLDLIQQKKDFQKDIWANSRVALKEYEDESKNIGTSVASWWKSSFDSMNESLATFCTTGKMNFRSLASSIITELVKIQMKVATGGLAGMLGSLFGSSTSGLSVASGTTSGYAVSGSIASGPFWTASAQGNAFTGNGVAKFATGGAFTNSIVANPTAFKFASGGSFQNGLMGEAGPEAVMPLTRMANGNLGVETSGNGGSATQNNVGVTVNIASDGSTSASASSDNANAKKLGELIAARIKETLIQEKRIGGLLYTR